MFKNKSKSSKWYVGKKVPNVILKIDDLKLIKLLQFITIYFCVNFIETCKKIPCGVTNIRWEITVERFRYQRDRYNYVFRWEPDTTGIRIIPLLYN